MEITVGLFLVLLVFAFVCEYIDSSMGMGYGTILTPSLIIMGFEPLVIIPAILLSQAFGGLTASMFHHQFKNVTFSRKSMDFKAAVVISGFGVLATIIAALISINLPKIILNSYIGLLILVMGIIVLMNRTFEFSWKKLIGVGILSAFNKGLSGGGFGPVVTGGQILSGQEHKAAVGVTTLAEAPICLVGFLTYMIGRTAFELNSSVIDMRFADYMELMFSEKIFQWELYLALIAGSIFVTPFGAFTTKVINKKHLSLILGILITILGLWTLYKTYA
ncbi:MAG: sulfite exporter TauE/SafE family protein [Melioribacteraceae bacterium]|nr:sulfite exporter TauE/SafE family protein [Melioribacteraceae bacterium]MCF8355032.1 sulfite exporter TauE/SafE family protein [Melioribacteraceae bacterium]MCF8392711.1 sulfite exporter TauE/SafE family protein [Melioribacteraceae bacterium]MCF8417733.1 sulfite exporter TauE/SafE family protein [Melioribacteraceae bacterium]